jgi:hypothetical protein
MNFLGHHEVARQLDGAEDHAYLFGTMVPDLAGMFRLKKLYKYRPVADERIQRGIGLHSLTNKVFDNIPAIKDLESSMATSFREYLPKWTALQCGRVGKDILFDGLFFSSQVALDSYNETMRLAASGMINFADITEPIADFTEGVQRLQEIGIPRYDDPSVVAKIIQRRLAGTRTPLDIEAVPELTMTFSRHQPMVLSMGRAAVNEVIAVLQG